MTPAKKDRGFKKEHPLMHTVTHIRQPLDTFYQDMQKTYSPKPVTLPRVHWLERPDPWANLTMLSPKNRVNTQSGRV